MEEDEPRQCVFCERVWGLVGLAAGAVILYIGADLVTGGALTRMLFRTVEVSDDDQG
jgi:hypothetical protein